MEYFPNGHSFTTSIIHTSVGVGRKQQLGQIVRCPSGIDNKTRVVTVRLRDTTINRPAAKVFLLPHAEIEETHLPSVPSRDWRIFARTYKNLKFVAHLTRCRINNP